MRSEGTNRWLWVKTILYVLTHGETPKYERDWTGAFCLECSPPLFFCVCVWYSTSLFFRQCIGHSNETISASVCIVQSRNHWVECVKLSLGLMAKSARNPGLNRQISTFPAKFPINLEINWVGAKTLYFNWTVAQPCSCHKVLNVIHALTNQESWPTTNNCCRCFAPKAKPFPSSVREPHQNEAPQVRTFTTTSSEIHDSIATSPHNQQTCA